MSQYIIETAQLGLRELTADDFEAWHKILSDPETMQHYPKPFDEEKTKGWIDWNLDNYQKYGFGLWAVILKETGQFVGDCGITMQNIHGDGVLYPEIGYHISKDFQRRGFASQAAKACLQYAFEHTENDEIFSYQKWTNIASRKTAEKMGMSFREEYQDEKNTKTSVYSITRLEYYDQSSHPKKHIIPVF
ncbi:MAG: GNAT family N-acetyltransferase [bacterium]|nr:GNAT family N-acetyltransferase [bacterium]